MGSCKRIQQRKLLDIAPKHKVVYFLSKPTTATLIQMGTVALLSGESLTHFSEKTGYGCVYSATQCPSGGKLFKPVS